MKILVACQTDDYKGIADNVLRWAANAGYQFRLFIPWSKQKRFEKVIKDVNWDWRMALDASTTLVVATNPKAWAKTQGYDLLVMIPDTLTAWRKDGQFADNEMVHYIKAIGEARIEFGKDDKLKVKSWANKVKMYRL